MKKSFMKLYKFFALITVIGVLMSFTGVACGAASYQYSLGGKAEQTPDAAYVYAYVDSQYSDSVILSEPSDICVDSEGNLYVVDTGNNRIVCYDSEYRRTGIIGNILMPDGSLEKLARPTGLFIDNNDILYIADTNNNRIVIFDGEGTFIRSVTADSQDVYTEDFSFRPLRVAADDYGNCYVMAENVYDGLMQFDTHGQFVGYVGANEVSISLWDLLWKQWSTQKQRAQLKQTLPTEFSGLDIDSGGFVYTVTSSINADSPESSDPVRKQTAKGINILKNGSITGKVIGDLEFTYSWSQETSQGGASLFTDITARQKYGFSCLDSKRGRIFTYNADSDLLFAFGDYGDEIGSFKKPVAIESYKDRIIVLDKDTCCITVFAFTDYAKSLIAAQEYYLDGDYTQSENAWRQVLKINSNSKLAYIGIGRIKLMQGDYSSAMLYFKTGGNKELYSDAMTFQRKTEAKAAFPYFLLAAAILIIGLTVLYFIRRHTPEKPKKEYTGLRRELRYALYVTVHPFNGFWSMAREGMGSYAAAAVCYTVYLLSSVVYRGMNAFLFREAEQSFNILITIAQALVPVILFCVCNWSVSTLFDGNGRPKDIITSVGYSLLPFTAGQVVCVALSYFLTLDEAVVVNVLLGFSIAWSAFLIFSAMATIHQYTVSKTVGTLITTLVGMAIVVFLVLLLFNLVQQMLYFIINLYRQITLRM